MKIAFVAYDINPTKGSECGMADLWLKVISKHYDVVVFTKESHKIDILNKAYNNVEFIFIKLPQWLQKLSNRIKLYPILNLIFTQKVKKILANSSDISLIHCITPAGIHSFNSLYKLGLPIIAGPIGGALSLPEGFRTKKNFHSSVPRFLYYYIIKYIPAWRNYYNNAKIILIGTNDLKDKLPIECRNRTQVFFDTAVNPEIFLPLEKKSSKIKICYIARLEYHKGIELLLQSCEKLFEEYENIELIIAGEGSYSKKIPNNNKIRYLGNIPRNEVITILQESDIYCLPTLREPGGVSILEAMSCGIPVVTTNYGGPAISVTNECGFKINPLNWNYYVEQLRLNLKILIENPDLRKSMGIAGRNRIKLEFSPESIERKIVQIYKEILSPLSKGQNNKNES